MNQWQEVDEHWEYLFSNLGEIARGIQRKSLRKPSGLVKTQKRWKKVICKRQVHANLGIQLYPNNHKTDPNILKPDTPALVSSEQKTGSMSFCCIVREVPSPLEILTPLVLQVADGRCGGFLQIRLTPGQARPCAHSPLLNNFHWSIIALQCCQFLLHSHVDQLCVHTCSLCLSPHPSLQVITGQRAELSARHRRLSFLRCFTRGGVYIPAPLSQFLPPSPSPLCPQVRSLGLCLYSCPANRVLGTIFLVCCVYFMVYKR